MAPRGRPVGIHDVSLPVGSDLLIWPGNPSVEVLANQRIARGDAANVSESRLGTHTDTHVDPPVHFVEGAIAARDLERLLPSGAERLLLRTGNSALWGGFRSPSPRRIRACQPRRPSFSSTSVRLVGTDFLSIC